MTITFDEWVALYQFITQQDVILKKLDKILHNQEKIMAVADDIKAALANLDAETTAIGALITKLAGGIKNSMTDAEVADVKAGFDTLSQRLTTLAVDPTQPVPPVPPPLAALKKK